MPPLSRLVAKKTFSFHTAARVGFGGAAAQHGEEDAYHRTNGPAEPEGELQLAHESDVPLVHEDAVAAGGEIHPGIGTEHPYGVMDLWGRRILAAQSVRFLDGPRVQVA
mmetsp:Transcript_73295/g.145374  ORF Transcript_73295/g.145374 Transcript_73295/m.145374 type:complete len:109 (+) Transcript_73295:73-399(+)|eukprot:CAMPEP_0172773418 /NCGR_PEP_ID=MMETSP1074-20121228/194257_1 /TAXON_ID=2916 /ORGANISM="Ceratium fusus, Strain PA161109" /LENGTH=108 /DNA_ID=CAMNT_0013609685 /DNA_START=86 /DNA_END=412 /DNA_ORIENTATION=+